MRRFVGVGVVVLAVAGCSADPPPPQVSFTAASRTSVTGPSQYCDVVVTHCDAHPAAGAMLRVPAGTPVTVGVPAEVASAPWQVAFGYRGPDGIRTQGRTPVFPPGSPTSYALTLPEAASWRPPRCNSSARPSAPGPAGCSSPPVAPGCSR